jgi:hypothetical protein
MNEQEMRQLLENEVAEMRRLSLKSTDPFLVAKGVAASDPNVQQLLMGRLSSGERLVEVVAFAGAGTTETQVFFRFIPREETVHLIDRGVLVFVDSIRGEVVGTIDPHEMHPEQRPARPFVAVSAPEQTYLVGVEPQARAVAEREQAFRERMALRRIGVINAVSYYDTIFGSESWSGGVPDDTRSDRTCDYYDQIVIVVAS